MNIKTFFIKPHFKLILTEIEKKLNLDDIDNTLNEIFNERFKAEENAKKQVIENIKYYDSLDDINLKYNTLLNFVLDERKLLDIKTDNVLANLFIRFLKNELSDFEVKKYLVFKIYDNAFASDYKKSFEIINEKFSDLLLPFYKYNYYIILFNRLLNSNNPGISDNLIDIETSLSSKLISQLKKALTQNISLTEEREQILNEKFQAQKKIIKIKSKNDSLNYKIEKQVNKIQRLKSFNNDLQFTEDQLYGDYVFGDYVMIYEKIYHILREYNSLNEPFSVFCYCLQLNKYNRILKKEIETNQYVTLRILGYMFYKLFQFSISRNILNSKFDLISFLESRFTVIDSKKHKKPLPKRYLIDIVEESSLTPNEIIIKDKIDSIFDNLL